MDLIKKLTGKNPSEYELVAKSLVDNSDVNLFAKLIEQDDFLFEFIKNNVSKRIQNACNKNNYLNLLNFFEYYSPSYDMMIASVLHQYSDNQLNDKIKEIFWNGSESAKAYAIKYFSLITDSLDNDIIQQLRNTAKSTFEPLAMNSIEVLSILNDTDSKNDAISRLESQDEFVQYEAVKFLVNFQAKDCIDKIIQVMKGSTLSENIASEIPYLIPINELMDLDFESAILVLCNIINAIPDIISPCAVSDYDLSSIFNDIPLTSSSAVLIRLAKDKFEELLSNDEYLFDCDTNTKNAINNIHKSLQKYNNSKLKSFFYDELYDGSDFVFFALDYVDEIEELEALLDSSNQTLILKVLTLLKDKKVLSNKHKNTALSYITSQEIKQIVEVL
jgi:hypothetical protein